MAWAINMVGYLAPKSERQIDVCYYRATGNGNIVGVGDCH